MLNELLRTGIKYLMVTKHFSTQTIEIQYLLKGLVIKGLSKEEHFVVLLVDRQKPSVCRDYDFDEERIGITKTGKVVWGFDSGCSCPTPWSDNYPECYKTDKNWKEFIVSVEKTSKELNGSFDAGWSEEAKAKVKEIKKEVAK